MGGQRGPDGIRTHLAESDLVPLPLLPSRRPSWVALRFGSTPLPEARYRISQGSSRIMRRLTADYARAAELQRRRVTAAVCERELYERVHSCEFFNHCERRTRGLGGLFKAKRESPSKLKLQRMTRSCIL